jgi:hypothetical protein
MVLSSADWLSPEALSTAGSAVSVTAAAGAAWYARRQRGRARALERQLAQYRAAGAPIADALPTAAQTPGGRAAVARLAHRPPAEQARLVRVYELLGGALSWEQIAAAVPHLQFVDGTHRERGRRPVLRRRVTAGLSAYCTATALAAMALGAVALGLATVVGDRVATTGASLVVGGLLCAIQSRMFHEEGAALDDARRIAALSA